VAQTRSRKASALAFDKQHDGTMRSIQRVGGKRNQVPEIVFQAGRRFQKSSQIMQLVEQVTGHPGPPEKR